MFLHCGERLGADALPNGINGGGKIGTLDLTRYRPESQKLILQEFGIESVWAAFAPEIFLAQCLGLRVSEILALQWQDIDFGALTMRVTRAAVHGVVDEVKTEYSEDDLPLDPDLATALLHWKQQYPASAEGWVFPSHVTGRCYHASPIQQDYIRPAGTKARAGRYRLAYLPTHLPVLAGFSEDFDGGATKTDAARSDFDHHESLRKRFDEVEAPSQQQGRAYGSSAGSE